ncbi:MarR family transcriptional regulator [Nocardia sp. NPDC050697]|uniref:MarR family transcriptional regulator n=1 Tax=Nocardia sp. NPDC050697 TaxID=3155158 RepID=UPI003407369C
MDQDGVVLGQLLGEPRRAGDGAVAALEQQEQRAGAAKFVGQFGARHTQAGSFSGGHGSDGNPSKWIHQDGCIVDGVNGVELLLLGRALMKIGEEAIPADGLPEYSTGARAVLVVAAEIAAAETSTVGEIAARTGLPQSAVSRCVARLLDAGSVVSEPDPGDRRRSLLRQAPQTSERVAAVRAGTIDAALATAIGTDDPALLAEVRAQLEQLAALLVPDMTSRNA